MHVCAVQITYMYTISLFFCTCFVHYLDDIHHSWISLLAAGFFSKGHLDARAYRACRANVSSHSPLG